jgi:hypothetical protein
MRGQENENFRRLLIVGFVFLSRSIAPLPLIYAPGGQTTSNLPGISDNALLFNRTDLTPTCQMEQLAAHKMHVYSYQNMVLMMNCSRKSDVNITIDSNVQTRYLALVMEQNQSCLLHLNISDSPPPGVQTLQQTLNFYWDIEPNASLQLQAHLRVHINGTVLNQELNRVVDTSRLTWMYWNHHRSEWEPVESYMDDDGYLTCETTHFSFWTVAEITPPTTPWMTYSTIGISAAAVLATVFLLRRR